MFEAKKIDFSKASIDPKKISPNSAEQKEPNLGLKDLSKAFAEKGIEIPQAPKKRRKPRTKKLDLQPREARNDLEDLKSQH